MAAFDKNAQITVKNETYSVDDLAKKLSKVPSEAIVRIFNEVHINFSRKLRMGILRSLLRPYVIQTKKEKEKIADEFSYRLSQFENFTDTQLVNLLEIYKNDTLVKDYYYNLWLNILTQLVERGIGENDFQRLIDLTDTNQTIRDEDSKQFNDNFNSVFYDEKGEIDGLTPEQFRPVTYKSTTLLELRSIGDKYNASVPKRLRKKELLEIIIKELKDRNAYEENLDERLSKMSILVLERYAKDNKIKVSTELRKEEIIEYILSNAKETKESYYVPTSSAVYETEQEEIAVSDDIILEVNEPEMVEVIFFETEKTTTIKGTRVEEPNVDLIEGYDFKGWYREKTFNTPWDFSKDVVTEPITLYPKFEEKEVTNFNVTYKNIKDEIYRQLNVAKNSKLVEPELEVDEAVTFEGWFTDKEFSRKWDFSTDTVTQNVTLYAKLVETIKNEVVVVEKVLPPAQTETVTTHTVISNQTAMDDSSVNKILEELAIIKKEVIKNNRSKKEAMIRQLLNDEDDDLTQEKVNPKEKYSEEVVETKEKKSKKQTKETPKKRRNFFVRFLIDLVTTVLIILIVAILLVLTTGTISAFDPNNQLAADINKVFDYIKIGDTGLALHITSFMTWLKNIFS
ncbi:Hypothetical protein BN85407180 [Alteracholeplasma palmae J233]|uniref:Rho termination factor-like N-terminal domain-containing protein n=1 Tax=Alteracholeplasma palmae (strain ATCC 49389 / J233) TaxID=1318466 RepID=U4KPT0_ALTPJ|nr:InlB B-repeat-containing protein [Alteracholeplasma palmae]CCV64295.1 Hypothetical protein BN85407180 [Alteracholeplasma palmae J233]